MADVVDKATRSRMMAGIRGKDTKPELVIRSALHRRGLRFKLHDTSLPGRPDLVFPKFRAVIFVQGCFWHLHACEYFKWPASNKLFWRSKLIANAKRDTRTMEVLIGQGWRVCLVWECALRKGDTFKISERISKWIRASDNRESRSWARLEIPSLLNR